MEFNRTILGARFRALRGELDYTQGFVADKSGLKQSEVSSFEKGNSGGLNVFLKLLNYYSSQNYKIDNILLPEFVIEKKNIEELIENQKEIIHKKQLKEIQNNIITEVTELESVLKAKLLSIKLIAAGTHADV